MGWRMAVSGASNLEAGTRFVGLGHGFSSSLRGK